MTINQIKIVFYVIMVNKYIHQQFVTSLSQQVAQWCFISEKICEKLILH